MANLNELYKQWCGEEPAFLEKIDGSGSNRQYYRIHGSNGQTVIGVIGTSRDEDHAFIYLSKHFERRKLPVPHILAVSEDELCYLQTDLGSVSLFDALKGGRMAGGRYMKRSCFVEPFVNFLTFSFVALVDWNGKTVILSQSLMRKACFLILTISSIVSSNPQNLIFMN